MRSALRATVLALPFFLSIPAETAGQRLATLAVHGGWSMTTFHKEGRFDWGWRSGKAGGVSATWPLSERLGLELGVGYVRKGFKENLPPVYCLATEGPEIGFIMDYAELSMLAKASLSEMWRVRIGGAPARRFRCLYYSELREIEGKFAMDVDPPKPCGDDDERRAFDFGLVLGLGASGFPRASS